MEVSSALGIPCTTHIRIARAVKEKRAMLEGPLTLRKSTVFSQVVKSKGWKKITPIIKKDVHNFVRRHPNIVTSPRKNDTVSVKDPTDPTKTIKMQKKLRQIPMRELHSDLVNNVPSCKVEEKLVVSEDGLRANMPPEVKPMSNRYKEMCSCLTCLKMRMAQEALNRYRRMVVNQLKRKHEGARRGSNRRKQFARMKSTLERQVNLSESVKDAVTKIHCNPPSDASKGPIFDGLYHVNCAYSFCSSCPS